VLLHEFGHALVARAFGLSPEIRLYPMGGLTSWGSEHKISPLKHLAISLAGPAIGFCLGGFVFAMGLVGLDISSSRLVNQLYFDLLWVNIGWGIFNLLPLLPMDGGQVLVTLEAWIRKRNDRTVSSAISFLFAAAISVAASRALSSERLVMATSAPASASASAMTRPSPRAPPVTRARRLVSLNWSSTGMG